MAMTEIRAFVRRWAAAFIVAAVFLVAGVAVLGVKIVSDHRHDAAQDRHDAQMTACMTRKTLNPPRDRTPAEMIGDCILETGH